MGEYDTCGYNPDFVHDAAVSGNDEYLEIHYPSSQVPKLLPQAQAFFDATSYGLLLYFTAIRLCLKKPTKTAKLRCAGIASILIYLIIVNILTIAIGTQRATVQQIFSFLILMFFIRSLRESWKRIFLVVWASLAIMVIILAYLLFFSLIGYTLFSNPTYVDPAKYF